MENWPAKPPIHWPPPPVGYDLDENIQKIEDEKLNEEIRRLVAKNEKLDTELFDLKCREIQ